MGSERRRIVLSLVGKQGAGKTTLGKKLARYLDTEHIELSDIVMQASETVYDKKELVATTEKTKEDPNWLGEALYEQLMKVFDGGSRTVVITGVREIEVYQYLKRRNLFLIGIDVTADPDIRFDRLFELKKVDTYRSFIQQDIREQNMGVNEVMGMSQFELSTTSKSDPDQLVRTVVQLIAKKGKNLR